MRFIRWKWWVWLPIGICCGGALAFFYGDVSASSSASRTDIESFQDALVSPRVVSHIRVYPPHEGIYLVTFDLVEEGKETPRFIYAKSPLTFPKKKPAESTSLLSALFSGGAKPSVDAIGGKTIVEYLQRLQIAHPAVSYTYAWWATERWRYGLFCAVGAILIGGVWPLVLGKLIKAGYGPPEIKEPKYDLEQFASDPKSKVPASGLSQQDIQHIKELDAELERQLAAGAPPADSAQEPVTGQAQTKDQVPVRLLATPLEALPVQTKEEKEYKGEFYPTVRGGPPKHGAFSLVELLVVIGIIGLLIAILLPALTRAKQTAIALTCANNLRSIGQGLSIYLIENQGTYPAAYLYIGHAIVNGVQTPTSFNFGYEHWSSYLYGAGKIPGTAFQCPAMNRGGLPPTNTSADNMDSGQTLQTSGVVDHQAPRLAYTVNEAICPRNKFVIGFQGARRIYQFVKASQIANGSGTILATEWLDNGLLIGSDTGNTGWMMSHRPVSGFIASNGTIDIFTLPPGDGFRKATAADMDPDPMTATTTQTHLDWVGRNHGLKRGYPDRRKTNFLYVDGHVVTKTIYETLLPFEWGEKFYSLVPSDDLVTP